MYIPRVGEILLCRFPYGTLLSNDEMHPVFVLQVTERTTGIELIVCGGSSQRVDVLNPGDFVVGPELGEAFKYSGLKKPTRFQLARRAKLIFNDYNFQVPWDKPCGETPKIGHLPKKVIEALVRPASDELKASRFISESDEVKASRFI